MKTYLLSIVAFISTIFIHAQTYKSLDTADYIKRKAFLKEYKLTSDAYSKELALRHSGSLGKKLAKQYKSLAQSLQKEISDKDYIFGTVFSDKVEAVFKHLNAKNPDLPQDFRVLIAKSNEPNAMCVGDGIYIVNIGLFHWVDNEAQLAAVLGHEVAHRALGHSVKSQIKNINKNIENKSIVSDLKNIQEKRRDKAFEIFKEMMYKTSEEQRIYEKEADSLGYILYKKALYPKDEYITILKNLKVKDTIPSVALTEKTYRSLYDLPQQPFQKKWLEMEDFSQYNYAHFKEKLHKDSLSTHPEIEQRIISLEKHFPELKERKKQKNSDSKFEELKRLAKMEILPNYFQSEEYGLGIYVAMQLIQENEEVEYHKKWLGKYFEKIAEARKNYKLNRYLDRVEPKSQSKDYQQFLSFMWNLSLSEINAIANHYKSL